MKIHLKRQNQAVHFIGTNDTDNIVHIDGSPAAGGENKGARPMQLLLMGIAGCSGIDIDMILKKMRQPLEDMEVIVTGEREEGAIPAVFTKIHLEFILTGDLKEEKVKKAIAMSMDTYCSVGKMLEKAAEITYGYTIK